MASRLCIRCVVLLGALAALSLLAGCFGLSGLPIAVFTVDPPTGQSPLIVHFDASDSSDPDGAIVRYDWEFGDGSTRGGRSTAHLYKVDVETVFAVRLTVSDDEGNQASTTRTLTVYPPPPPASSEQVEFVWPFHFDADGDDAVNLNDEYFTLENTGDASVDLGGWTVSNERGLVYQFPAGTVLAVGAVVFVHSGAGVDAGDILYWDAPEPVWHNDSDIAVLRDPTGLIVDLYAYTSC